MVNPSKNSATIQWFFFFFETANKNKIKVENYKERIQKIIIKNTVT